MTYRVTINTITRFLRTKKFGLILMHGFFLFSAHPFLCYSQDLYSLEQSKKYAEYLFSSQQHTLAAEEYERLVYLDSNNIRFKYNLIKSYRLAGDFNMGIRRIYFFYGNSTDTMPQILASEFVKLQILSDSLSVVENFIKSTGKLSAEYKSVVQSCDLLLNGNYKAATLLVNESAIKYPEFPVSVVNLTQRANSLKHKSPYLAAGFSVIIPGSGKFYTKNWSDGIFALLFVAGNAWQAYRGFNEHGMKSAYGWVFAGLSTSFYIGNVFGSVKAAKRYNKDKKNEIDNQVFEFVSSDSF